MNRIKSFLLASMFLLPTMAQQAAAPAIPQDKKIEQKVEALLKKMTLEEKIGHLGISKSSLLGKAGNLACGSAWYQKVVDEISDFWLL